MIGKDGRQYINLSIMRTPNKPPNNHFVGIGDRHVWGVYDVPNRVIFECDIPIDELMTAINDEKKRDGVE